MGKIRTHRGKARAIQGHCLLCRKNVLQAGTEIFVREDLEQRLPLHDGSHETLSEIQRWVRPSLTTSLKSSIYRLSTMSLSLDHPRWTPRPSCALGIPQCAPYCTSELGRDNCLSWPASSQNPGPSYPPSAVFQHTTGCECKASTRAFVGRCHVSNGAPPSLTHLTLSLCSLAYSQFSSWKTAWEDASPPSRRLPGTTCRLAQRFESCSVGSVPPSMDRIPPLKARILG